MRRHDDLRESGLFTDRETLELYRRWSGPVPPRHADGSFRLRGGLAGRIEAEYEEAYRSYKAVMDRMERDPGAVLAAWEKGLEGGGGHGGIQ